MISDRQIRKGHWGKSVRGTEIWRKSMNNKKEDERIQEKRKKLEDGKD